MSSRRSKRHHFVPKVLQRQFCVEKYTLFYATKTNSGGWTEVSRRNIASTFYERNLYTVNVDGVPSDVVEREFYGKIDDFIGDVFPALTQNILTGTRPVFSERSLESVREVVFEMLKRTPDFADIYDDLQFAQDYCLGQLEKMDEVEIRSEWADSLRALLEDHLKLREFGRTSRVEATIGRSELIHAELQHYDVRWALAPSRSSYVLSSRNAHRLGNGGSNGFENPNMEIWMPISPRVCMILLRDGARKVPWRVLETSVRVRRFNEWVVSNSTAVASGSEKLLRSLLGQR